MSTLKTSKIRSALLKKGFKQVNKHHEMFWYHDADKKTQIHTRLSYSISEYDDSLLAQMAIQLKLSKSQLNDLVACPLSDHDYRAILIRARYLSNS